MLPPYKLIMGSDEDLTDFEQQVTEAMLVGYELSGDLITQPSDSGVLLFQAMTNDEVSEYEDDEEEDDDDEEYDPEDEE